MDHLDAPHQVASTFLAESNQEAHKKSDHCAADENDYQESRRHHASSRGTAESDRPCQLTNTPFDTSVHSFWIKAS
jgi:hypothetical protein